MGSTGRLSKASIARIEIERPELHGWLARILAERLTTSQLMFESRWIDVSSFTHARETSSLA